MAELFRPSINGPKTLYPSNFNNRLSHLSLKLFRILGVDCLGSPNEIRQRFWLTNLIEIRDGHTENTFHNWQTIYIFWHFWIGLPKSLDLNEKRKGEALPTDEIQDESNHPNLRIRSNYRRKSCQSSELYQLSQCIKAHFPCH